MNEENKNLIDGRPTPPPTPGSKSDTLYGHHLATTIDMEPGSACDDEWDSYCISVKSFHNANNGGSIYLRTLDEIRELNQQISEYLRNNQP